MKYLRLFERFLEEYDELQISDSTIENAGLGLFTLVDIDENSLICEFDGQVISEEDASNLQGERGHYLVAKSDGTLLDVFNSKSPAIRANDAYGTDFENNSFIEEQEDGTIWLVSKRNIYAGEEIFCEYGQDYWDNWKS